MRKREWEEGEERDIIKKRFVELTASSYTIDHIVAKMNASCVLIKNY